MEKRKRWAKSPRLRARWRRRYNRNGRRVGDGMTKLRMERFSMALGALPPHRRSWSNFIAEWDAYFNE